jgi:signal transduction histidine kinase
LWEVNPQEIPGELERVEELARHTTEEIRHMLFTLRPLSLESEGIIPALQQMSDKMKETFQQNVTLDIDPVVAGRLDLNKQTMVFYLVEEAVNNARKHAEAEEIHVSFKFINSEGSLALLEIADNGKGFDISSVTASYDRRGSLGMVNLQERTALVNGLLHIESTPGRGTRVQIVIPLTAAAVERLQRGDPQ